MSTSWYAIEEAITVAKINEVNEKLNVERAVEENVHPITFKHNLLSDSHWLERTETDGTHHALEVIDFNGQNFGLMKRWGMGGANGTGEAILRPLIELGKITIVSEHDPKSPPSQAQLELYEEQQRQRLLKTGIHEEVDHEAVNKRITEQKEENKNFKEDRILKH